MKLNKKIIIVKDRVDLYRDFVFNLFYTIDSYYLDYESLNTDKDINNHYTFCFNRVCDEFLKEEIDFKSNRELKSYFQSYYVNQYYKAHADAATVKSTEYFIKFWNSIFEIDKQKDKKLMSILIEMYGVFDKSFKQEKNILEMV